MRKNALMLISGLMVSIFALFIYYAYKEMSQKTQIIAYSMADYAASNYKQAVEKKFEELYLRGELLCDGIEAYPGTLGKTEQALLKHLLAASLCQLDEVCNAWIYLNDEKLLLLGKDDSCYHNPFSKWMALDKYSLEGKGTFISEPFVDKKTGRQLVTFAIPVMKDQKGRGLIGFEMDLMEVHRAIANQEELGFGYLTVISKEGHIAIHPDEKRLGHSVKEYAEFENYQQYSGQEEVQVSPILTSDYLGVQVLHISSSFHLSGLQDWTVVVSVPVFNFMDRPEEIRRKLIVVGAISVLLLLLVQYFALGRWQKEVNRRLQVEEEKRNLELQNEKVARENVQAQLENLKNQLNPHFLFNSLSSLFSLVEKDKELARKFVIKLSKLYRNLLLKNKESLSSVGDEAEFTEHYLFLQKIRFGEALLYHINIDPQERCLRIPTHSLIMLVENAIKHNIITRDQPLEIHIKLEASGLWVMNNYNPNNNKKDKLGTGLKNLSSRYSLMGGRLPEAYVEGNNYIACLPFLHV